MCRTGNQGDEEGRRKGRGERQKRGRGANMDARWAKKGASSECARRRDIRDGRQGALAGFDLGSFSAASGCASLLEVRAGWGLADQRSSGVD